MNEIDKQKIKDDVQNCFIERNENTIAEKISELIKAGMTEDEAIHAVTQTVRNLSNCLMPLKIATKKSEDVHSDELTVVGNAIVQRFTEWPRTSEDDSALSEADKYFQV